MCESRFSPWRRSLQTRVDELFEFRALADRIRSGQSQAQTFPRQQLMCRRRIQPRGVDTDAAAADRGIGAAAEAQSQVDGLRKARQRKFLMSDDAFAPGFVTHNEHIRLAAMEETQGDGGVSGMKQRP